ncbi:MAG: MlaD family protein [Pelovirga sp.]
MHTRKKVDPRVIGTFVIGAIILIVAGILFFGPGGLFSDTRRYVTYFESSVKGLNVGSPVRFRGVRIGQVKEINISFRSSDLEFHIPVVIEIDPKKIRAEGSEHGIVDTLKTSVQTEDPILPLIAEGLRAQLQLDSLVTGQLFVNIDMMPGSPLTRVDIPGEYPQIPAISSGLAELTKTIEEIPLQLLVDKLMQSADGVQRLFNSPELHNAIKQFDTTTALLNDLLTQLNDNVPQLLSKAELTLDSSRETLTGIDENIDLAFREIDETLALARSTLDSLEQRVEPLAQSFDEGMDSFKKASDRVSSTMIQVESLTADDSQLLQQLGLTLQELNRTLRSMRYLADEIERNPQILLRGRSVEE